MFRYLTAILHNDRLCAAGDFGLAAAVLTASNRSLGTAALVGLTVGMGVNSALRFFGSREKGGSTAVQQQSARALQQHSQHYTP